MASRIDPSRPGTIVALGWDVREQLANAKRDIEDLQGGPSAIEMPTGDIWLTANATFDGTNWQRIDASANAYAIVFQWNSTIPGEAVFNSGLMLLRALPGANPIGPFWSVGGWEDLAIFDQFRHIIVGGFGIEVDGSGIVPYGRFTHYGPTPTRTGTLTNLFVDLSGVDDNASPSWFIGRKDDSAIIERAPAGSLSLAQLWQVGNTGMITENAVTVSGAASPGTSLLAAVNIITAIGGGNFRLATASNPGQKQVVINATASAATINPPAGGTVAGVATVSLAASAQRTFYASAANVWW